MHPSPVLACAALQHPDGGSRHRPPACSRRRRSTDVSRPVVRGEAQGRVCASVSEFGARRGPRRTVRAQCHAVRQHRAADQGLRGDLRRVREGLRDQTCMPARRSTSLPRAAGRPGRHRAHPEHTRERRSASRWQRCAPARRSPLRDRARDDDEIAAVPAAVRPEVAGAGDQHQPGWPADVEDLLVVDQVGARHLA
jgi:hypothetical protein